MRVPVALIVAQRTGATTEAQIQQKLESEGYSKIKVREHAKAHIDVTAAKNGKTEKLAVDPKTGAAKPDEDED
jgi:hypothetical protein